MVGTATQAQVWFLLEQNQIYGARPLEDSLLPVTVKDHLATLVRSISGARVQLIKRDFSPFPDQISFFVGITSEIQPQLFEFLFRNVEELLTLDLEQLLGNRARFSNHLRQEPLYLVCTNGKRDPCCSRYGLSLYHSLLARERASTWQTSHVGGHRFAPNLVCFPHGLFYGRLEQGELSNVIDSYRKNQYFLKKFRGRSCFSEPVQAAEVFLHDTFRGRMISDFSLESFISPEENKYEITFQDFTGRERHRLTVLGTASEFEILMSCREIEKTRVTEFHLEAHQSLGIPLG